MYWLFFGGGGDRNTGFSFWGVPGQFLPTQQHTKIISFWT